MLKYFMTSMEGILFSRWFKWCCGLAILVIAVGVVSFYYYAGTQALKAEERLQSTLYTIRLVDLYVQAHGKWPASWHELETVAIPPQLVTTTYTNGEGMYAWPQSSKHFQQYVIVDFSANPGEIAEQTSEEFVAVRPSGVHYPYEKYGFIQELQQTLRAKGFGKVKK